MKSPLSKDLSERVPDFLSPLQQQRQIQWTKTPRSGAHMGNEEPKLTPSPKKVILKKVMREKAYQPLDPRHRNHIKVIGTSPQKNGPPSNPMYAPSPVPGNAMHTSPKEKMSYNG